eukprot:scaffold20741_cov91-Skeletonema_dohrnii-CCMP3373.AAC.2
MHCGRPSCHNSLRVTSLTDSSVTVTMLSFAPVPSPPTVLSLQEVIDSFEDHTMWDRFSFDDDDDGSCSTDKRAIGSFAEESDNADNYRGEWLVGSIGALQVLLAVTSTTSVSLDAIPPVQAHCDNMGGISSSLGFSIEYHHVKVHIDKVLRWDQLTCVQRENCIVDSFASIEHLPELRLCINEDTYHVVRCPSPGRTAFYNDSVSDLIEWLKVKEADTDPQLVYSHSGRGDVKVASLFAHDLPIYGFLASLMDEVGFDNFVEGPILTDLLLRDRGLLNENIESLDSSPAACELWIADMEVAISAAEHARRQDDPSSHRLRLTTGPDYAPRTMEIVPIVDTEGSIRGAWKTFTVASKTVTGSSRRCGSSGKRSVR